MIIITEYKYPTDTTDGRITATGPGGKRKTIFWKHTQDIIDNHKAAAKALLEDDGKVYLSFYHEKIGYVHLCGNPYQAKYWLEVINKGLV